MSETKPKTEKGSEEGGTGRFCRHQDRSSNFIRKKEKTSRRCEDIKNDVFDLVLQGQNKLFADALKAFYFIYGIKYQKKGSNVQYTINNIYKPTLSAPSEASFEASKSLLTMVQKGILNDKTKKSLIERKCCKII